MSGRVEFEFATRSQPVYRPGPRREMRILLAGDFSGRGNRGLLERGAALAERPLLPVDVDNLEDVLFRFAPRLHLPLADAAGPGMAVEFKQLDDFHPDELHDRLELFRELRRTRARLLDPATFPQAAAELTHEARETPAGSPAARPPDAAPAEDDAATLERLLGRARSPVARRGPAPAPATTDITPFIRHIVAPHVVPEADPRQEPLVASVDQAIGARMRAVLHHPAFQELEALWRSLAALVRGIDTDEGPRVFVLDVTREELAADLGAAGPDVRASAAHRAVVDRHVGAPGGEPWSLVVGDFTFDASADDVSLLRRLGRLAAEAGGPLLAAACPTVLGCGSLAGTPDPADWPPPEAAAAERWRSLRRDPAARWIGLALPGVLLRLPYGKKTDPIERFEFEELTAPGEHDALLWGNPALAATRLIAAAYQDRGWAMQPGDLLDLEDLPAHVYEVDGESRMTPCAGAWLTERAGTAILERGIMPLLSHRDRNAVRVLRFQSLADPPAGLAGPWNG